MNAITKKYEEQLLALSVDDRLYLVDKLLRSLNVPSKDEIDKAWAEEIDRRVDDIKHGKVKLIPAEFVFKELGALH